MAMTKEENDLITKVEGDAPLGGLLKQHFWLPAAPAAKLEADGAPLRIRLVGENYVLFRNTDGELGVLDELCPHRKVSLTLGRNEKNGLRCIYHGWNFDKDGNLIDAPNVEGDKDRFCKSVKINKYKVVEKGGIAWLWLGKGDTPPPFPDLPFTNLPEEQRAVASVVVPTNWLQGVEASMDTTHVSWLHSSTTEIGGNTQIKNL
ncbi:MAG: Rieske 2Fe-2S domain-containing protein, partial [Caulobacterales bacterium]|nr:Rieske 2Fe-2S domain-containing protein [Caulobacterales bacterium]